ncbi:unnamed protein product [Durusdinium trenchii]|uniref:Core-binding (CB) domain-containing protein n=1 Tax=Durusdinium trenchii TaxID=1381693 RepID=A0ABP0PMV2_9DINO
MTDIAKAIQQQTNELATLVKAQQESTAGAGGSLKGLGKTSEELVYLLRACGQYTVQVGDGEYGAALAQALLTAQAGSSTKLRTAGFRQRVTSRLAIGIAGPYWGTQEKYALSASDFVPCTDAELDQFAIESRTGKPSNEQRPAAPTRYEDWLNRAKRQNDIWALVYGSEWKAVREHAVNLLSEWHIGAPHKWPLQVLLDVWEELHWRFLEELKEELRKIKRLAGRESMTLNDLKFYALMPDEEGRAPLELPQTFDLRRPDGWFMSEVMPRIERRQERMLWKMTWEGAGKNRAQGQTAGGDGGSKEEKLTLKTLYGPKLTAEETARAKDRAPTNKEGKLLCWGYLSHLGCSQQGCQRAHEPLKGPFESLDPAVQLQLLRRGGLKRMKAETKDTATEKIKEIRAGVAKDKASKVQDGKDRRRAGQGDQPQGEGEGHEKAGGHQGVSWEAPEEMVQVDYTHQEKEFAELVAGPDATIYENVHRESQPHPGREGQTAPQEAQDLVRTAQKLANRPVLSKLQEASDDLYAWASTRVANDPETPFETLMEEMVQFGLGELAAEAAYLLEAHGRGPKAGNKARCRVEETRWEADGPGKAVVQIDEDLWAMWDFGEMVHMTEELAGLLGMIEPEKEKRQCVTKVFAAGLLLSQTGRTPSMDDVEKLTQDFRLEQARLAVEAEGVMSHPEAKVAPVEHELRMYAHDILKPHHDKDYRALAVFPLAALEEIRVIVVRVDYKGDILLETVVGVQTAKAVHGAKAHDGLVLREYFAGHGVITQGWREAGMVALEPIELYDQPHQQLGPRPDHDLANPARQKHYLDQLGQHESNVQWIASPCTTFCDWCLQNGGTRTFQNPAGLPTEKERIGNVLSEYGAAIFEKSMQQGGFPIAESSGTSGTQGQFYRHRTGLAFPHHPPLRQALLRLCPGISQTHQHVALKGSRPGVMVSRCTEAGVYAPNFVRAVVETLIHTLVGGGGKPQPLLSKTGGRPYGWNVYEEDPPAEEEEEEAEFHQGLQHLNQEELQQVAGMAVEAALGVWNGRTIHEPEETVEESVGTMMEEPDEALEEPDEVVEPPDEGEAGQGQGGEAAGSGESVAEPAAAYRIVWADLGQRNRMEVDAQRGYVWLYTNEPRDDLAVPDELPYPYWPHRFHSERYTRCETRDTLGRLRVAEVYDDWRVQGRGRPPFVPWTGVTLFVFRDGQLPWSHVLVEDEQNRREGPDEPDRSGGGPGDDRQGWTSSHHTGWQGLNQAGVWQDWSSGTWQDSRAGGSRWVDFEEEGISGAAATAAMAYIQEIDGMQGSGPATWQAVRERGDMLLGRAGSVEKAAIALWIAREHLGRNNLQGVDSEELDPLVHPDHLDYLREVRAQGMPARYQGQRERVATRPHPRARADLGQVYVQLMKDIMKHRVLVVSADHQDLGHTVSSPFELVPKMLPNRTLSTEARLVHDQRQVNEGTHKDLHPPAAQPTHEQVARRVLWLKARYPGVKVVMAKKDVAGAFRLLWVDPRDVELFAGDVPWRPECMEQSGGGGECDGSGLTLIYLVSSFGFSGSPGEWTVWGRATEEVHRNLRPLHSRRDGEVHFCGKILVDDMVLVEPVIGLRPWVSSEVYEWAVVKLLGEKAINKLKDAEEGQFSNQQTVWGLTIDTDLEKMSLPEARILKGAYLLAQPHFNYGNKALPLKELQRFRGIANGWSAVIAGLRNELKAADLFLGGVDGGAAVHPRLHQPEGSEARRIEETSAWEALWELFEDCRWLCSRSETWAAKFGGDIRELLPPLERLALPGQRGAGPVFVSSDATPDVVAAIDWTNHLACREPIEVLKPWIRQVLEAEGQEDGKLAIHLGEMLSFVAFACRVGHMWEGRVVIYAGDNKVVYFWITGRKSGVRAGRLLIRVLNLVEKRHRCRILGGWWRTFHNEDADALTRLDEPQALQLMKDKGWSRQDIKPSIHQALEDTERFGLCFLSWADQEDRHELMRLRELRVFRAIFRQPADLLDVEVVEWTPGQRYVKDLEYFSGNGNGMYKIVAGTIGPDPKGRKVTEFTRYLDQEIFDVAVLEGPTEVMWRRLEQWAISVGWGCSLQEFLTSELGEALVRRRIAGFLFPGDKTEEEVERLMVKTVTPPSMGSYLRKITEENCLPTYKMETAINVGQEAMLPMVTAHVWLEPEGQRHNVYSMGGPGRWPLSDATEKGMQKIFVQDKAAPVGKVRVLSGEEVWILQGRRLDEWRTLVSQIGEVEAEREGCRATGRRTALNLIGAAAELAKEVRENKAGMCIDQEDYKTLGSLLQWLRKWRRGDFGRAPPNRKAGGQEVGHVWFWGEELWLGALEFESGSFEGIEERRCGGRRKGPVRPVVEDGGRFVDLNPDFNQDMEIQAQIEEWLEAHLTGDKAESTQKAYLSAWNKWCDWSKRQGWLSPYLDHRGDPIQNENKVLGYLGYLGWLGTSAATMKQAVFAIKDAHKRAGHGDTTTKMHRLWIVLNSLEKHSVKRPRRLGVTVQMLKWLGKQFVAGAESFGELKVDCRMIQAALLTAWFFMLRAREFADSSGVDQEMVVRGQDISLTTQGQADEMDPEEVTLQFRKTKADQEAFGTCKTMKKTEIEYVCVVTALHRLREVAPRRFGKGPESHLPLFRWASGAVIKRLEVQNLLQKAAKALGLPAERFQSHSLRIGGASALYQATGEIEVVKRTGRWTSSAVQRYLHDSGDVLAGLAKKMATVDQHVHYT